MKTKEPEAVVVHNGRSLSTGSSLLNCAMTDNPFGGLLPGKYYLWVGDSAAGKTMLCMTCLAEAVMNRRFRKYTKIYDNIEDGCLIDLEKMFNKQVAEQVIPPAGTREDPKYSETVEEFYFNVDDAVERSIESGNPFIYVLDSADALTSESSEKKFDQHKRAFRKRHRKADKAEADGEEGGKEEKVAGSYGDGKAKLHSERLRKVVNGITKTGSILIILSQTRDNLGFGFEKKTRSGGRALKFYATVELWLSIVGKIKKTVGGSSREIGVRVCAEVKKNRITGKLRSAEVDIYPSYGVDDLGSLVDFLVEEKEWKLEKQTIKASGLGMEGTRDKIIRRIEDEGLQTRVQEMVGLVWNRIERECALKRRPRYGAVLNVPERDGGKE